MAGSKTNWLEAAVLGLILRNEPLTLPSSLYLALSTAPFNEAGLTAEVATSGTAYARQAVARSTAAWSAPIGTPTASKNVAQISFPVATAGWGTVTSFYLMDAAAGGNSVYGADLAVPKSILVGDAASFYANTITVAED